MESSAGNPAPQPQQRPFVVSFPLLFNPLLSKGYELHTHRLVCGQSVHFNAGLMLRVGSWPAYVERIV